MQGFVSYAHADIAMCHELLTHLDFLKRVHGITLWTDDDIRAGDHWDSRIRDAIQESDFFLLLISPRWLSRPYIQEEEIPAIHARATATERPVIAIILTRCSWDEEYGRLQAVPTREKKLVPVDAWRPRNDGYHRASQEIVTSIRARFNPAKITRDWGQTLAAQEQDSAGILWYKLDRAFIIDSTATHSDVAVAEDQTSIRRQRQLHDRATRFAAELQGPHHDTTTAGLLTDCTTLIEALAGHRTEVVDPELDVALQQQPNERFQALQRSLLVEMAQEI